ncbi:MAG: sarcosine oxidase subunit beta family protein [Pseudomonadota bacterium]
MGGDYSAWRLLHRGWGLGGAWKPAWSKADPKKHYEVVIVGGGGHGLATAYYLAKNHGLHDVLVLEAGWLGGGNTGRNTTIIRSDYFLEASGALKEFALELWEGLSQELNYNLMVSQRGYVDLAHSDGELEAFTLRANAMLLRGSDAAILDRQALKERVPPLNLDPKARFPIVGALLQERGGTLRHDAVAWAYARAASRLGVDIIEQCPVTGFEQSGNRIAAVTTAPGTIGADNVVVSVAGQSSQVAKMAGFRLPLQSIPVQAFVSEPVKPALDVVVNFNAGLAYVGQTDKGELVMGGATEGYPGYRAMGGQAAIEHTAARIIEMFPFTAKMRLMRQWGGIADIPMDGNAIMGATPVDNLTLNAGWGYAGFKATPAVGWTIAQTVAQGRAHPLIAPFALDRFESGALIDDAGAGPAPWLH